VSLRFSVIIPTYKDWAALAQCLDALAGQTVGPEAFEIVIGNNNPEAALPEGVVLPPNARVVHQPRPGSYAARNAAVGAACGDVLCFTDSDCLPEPDWLENAGALFDREREADRIGGGVVLIPKGEDWTLPELYDRIFGLRQERYVAHGYAATANLIVRRTLFERVGPFNEDLYSSGDKEWNRRAGAVGSRIVLGRDVLVRHPARASYAELEKKRLRVAGGRLRMKGARRGLSLMKYRLPSLPALGRILVEPEVALTDKLRLWEMDTRLRRAELAEYRRIGADAGTRRE